MIKKLVKYCLILTTATLMVAVLSACSGSKPEGPLVMLEWTGYESSEYWEDFAKQHPDVKVDFTFFVEEAEAFAKLQSGFQADLVHPNSSWLKLYVENDLLQPIDTSRLSNWPDVMDDMAKFGQVNGVQYLIPWEWGYNSITVRTDKVEKVPESWADIWDPQYKGHVSIYDSADMGVVVTALTLGYDPYNLTDEQLEAIKQKLIELKPNLLGYWGDYTEIIQQLASGEVWIGANTWSDAYLVVHRDGIDVEYLTPKEGRLGWVYGYAIPKNAKNIDLAYDQINARLAPQAMANMANYFGYGVVNPKAIPLIDPELVQVMQLDQPDIVNRTFFLQPLSEEQRQKWTSLWDQVKATQ